MNPSLAQLLTLQGLDPSIAQNVDMVGDDPVFDSRYRIAMPGAAAIAASAVAAAELWKLKTGRSQDINVSARQAAAAMRSNHYFKIDGQTPPRPSDKVTGFYQTQGERWIYLHCNFRNLRERNLGVLAADPTPESVAEKAARWDGFDLEEAIVAAGGCAALVRSEDEWNALPQSRFVGQEPLLQITRIGEAPPEPLPAGPRPLSGIRVLDLTRVLAGPTAARTLAEHGADVLRVSRQGMPDSGLFDYDTGLGKRSTFIDLSQDAGVQTLRTLVRDADVFSQAYRPGSLAARGFSPTDLAALRPGIVYVTLSAWGFSGPWAERRGYDTVVQSANGMAFHGVRDRPQFMPVSAQDYVAGYLMAFGAMVALARRAREGGSWEVKISLAGTGHWIRQHGLIDPSVHQSLQGPSPDEIEKFSQDSNSPAGRLTHLAPVARMSETAPRWERPAVPLGTHPPQW